MEWIYRPDKTGNKIHKRLVTGKNRKSPRGQDRPARHFSETLLKAYYAKECEDGSRFRSGFTKNFIKRAHERAIQRWEQLGVPN